MGGAIFGAVILFIAGIGVFAMRGGRATKAGLPSAQTEAGTDWGRFGQFQAPVGKQNPLFAKRSAAASPLAAAAASAVPTSAPAPGQGDPLDRLEKLNQLHAKGAISEAEFAAATARILGSI